MKLAHLKYENEAIPWGYGPAWRDFYQNCYVCYPMPLHILARWGRDFRFWLMEVGLPGYKERVEHEAYCRGLRKGSGDIGGLS